MILGVIFVLLIVFVAERIFWTYRDYQDAKAFVDETITAVVPTWDKQELNRRFAPAALEGYTDQEIEQVFRLYRVAFDSLVYQGEAEGNVKANSDGITLGVFTVPLEFKGRSAEATVTVQKFKRYWAITDFRVKSDAPSKKASEPEQQTPKA